jgi:hypothetical protein
MERVDGGQTNPQTLTIDPRHAEARARPARRLEEVLAVHPVDGR